METILLNYLTEYGLIAIIASFIVGIISSLNPCSMLTLPFFIASSITLSNDLENKQRKVFIYKYSLLFFIGLSLSYSVLLLILSKIGTMINFSSFWIYILVGVLALVLVGYSLNLFGSINTSSLTQKLIPYKYVGAVVIGFIHGFLSSPCGSAPFIALLTLASQTNWLTSYTLLLSFAMGQAMILLLSGFFIGSIQNFGANKWVSKLNSLLNKTFILVLFLIGVYFIYKGVLVF